MNKYFLLIISILLFFVSCSSSEKTSKPTQTISLPQNSFPPQTDTVRAFKTIPTPPSSQTQPAKLEQNIESPKPEAKSSWPPEGAYCRQFVDCCEEAQKIRGKVSMLCLSIASRDSVDCQKGIQEVAEFLKNLKVSLPRYCE